MSAATSRRLRWYSDGMDPRSGPEQTSVDGGFEGQARGAIEALALASRSANDRLDRGRRNVQTRVVQVGAAGMAAVAGMLATRFLPTPDIDVGLGLVALCAATAVSAGAALAWTAWTGDPVAESAAAAVASDLALSAQAKQLAQLAVLLDQEPATSAHDVLGRLVAQVAESAGAARDREGGIRGSARLQGRRHERIVPRQTRVQVTVADGRSLNARIVDVSRSGVALEGNFPGCGLGQHLRVGSRRAHVVRVLPRGLACEFGEVIAGDALTPDIVL